MPFVVENLDTQWERSQEERFPGETFETTDEVGLRLINVPEEYGGEGFEPDVLTECLVLEPLRTPARGPVESPFL